MNATTYQRVIHQWCETTGMQPWTPDGAMHIDLDGTTIALVYSEAINPMAVDLYADLGQPQGPEVHAALLCMNMPADSPGRGWYALHPESGSIVYRVPIPLDDATDGTQLPAQVSHWLRQARDQLRA